MKHASKRPLGEMEDTTTDRVIAIVVFVILIVGGLASVFYGGKAILAGAAYAEARRATAECEKWADQAMVYPGYFLVGWQKEQCDTYGVAVDAPVKTYKQ